MPPEVLNRIFDPFFTTRLERGGTSLGLSISYAIIEDQQRAIEVESEPAKGSSVYVCLPHYRQKESAHDKYGNP